MLGMFYVIVDSFKILTTATYSEKPLSFDIIDPQRNSSCAMKGKVMSDITNAVYQLAPEALKSDHSDASMLLPIIVLFIKTPLVFLSVLII